MTTLITSLQNQRIKEINKLNKRNERERRRLTVVEGIRESERALEAGIQPVQAFLCSDLLGQHFGPLTDSLRNIGLAPTAIFDTTPPVFAKIAYRGESGGIVLVVPYFSRPLNALLANQTSQQTVTFQPSPDLTEPLLLVLEGVEKPGNLGAILRTADAAGVHGVILTDAGTDIHNPNTIRAALGASFTVPVSQTNQAETAAFLQHHSFHIIATTPEAQGLYWDADLRGPVAILMGSEAQGLSDFWLQHAHARVRLPMYGAVDSLNLSTSTAIVLYEALRQRSLYRKASF